MRIITDSSPKLMSNTKPQIQEVHRTHIRMNPKQAHPVIAYLNLEKQRQRKSLLKS
jgi:hypothetical protein